MTQMRFRSSFVVATFVLAACGDDVETRDLTSSSSATTATSSTAATTTAATATATTGAGGAGGGPVVFGACPEGYGDECAVLKTPLDHAHPEGETIDLHVARLRATRPATRQLWLLSGGPGQGGHIWTQLMPILAAGMPDTDIYAIDHRGTGHSHRLTCTDQDRPGTAGGYLLDVARVPACLDELRASGDYDRLAYFTTAQAARDVVLAIGATRTAGQRAFVYGGSYGTHWAHRVLQVGEAEIDGIVFDGFMTPDRFAFTRYDTGVDEVGAILSAGCAADAECGARLGPDPAARARDVWAALDDTPCAGVDGDYGRTLVSLFVDGGLRSKAFVFPLVHRLARCSVSDVDAINTLFAQPNLFGGGDEEPFLNSGILQYNIVLSELWSVPGEPLPTAEELAAAADAQTFLVQSSYPAGVVGLRDTWPLPPDDHAILPTPVPTQKPLLWLSGGLDSRTPPSQSTLITGLYQASNQPLVVLPTAVHTPAWGSPLATDPMRTCGMTLIPSFVNGALDTSCVENVAPVHYHAPDPAFATTWWGQADDWGDEPTLPPVVSLAVDTTPVLGPALDALGAARARRALDAVRVRLRDRATPVGTGAATASPRR